MKDKADAGGGEGIEVERSRAAIMKAEESVDGG